MSNVFVGDKEATPVTEAEVKEKIRIGIKQSAAGEVHDLGSFAEHLNGELKAVRDALRGYDPMHGWPTIESVLEALDRLIGDR